MSTSKSKEEFVDMITALMSRCKEGGAPIAYRRPEHVGSDDMSTWGSMAYNIHGKIYVDDDDIEPTREGGRTSTPMFGLHKIDEWPTGLFEKLSGYTWWLDPDEEIPVLDVLAGTPRDQFRV